LEVGVQIAKGLQAGLEKGLIHRDIKPGNILFADENTAKIVDFGLAVLQEHASTVAGEVWGTPYYVAPEKLDNKPEDFRSDMYSLGGTLFHALAGRPPFEAETASMVALKHIKSQAVSLQAFAPEVSSATAYVINKTLEKEPRNRYQSYEELIEHLEYARNQLLAAAARGPAAKARVVLEDEGSARAMTWLTFGMVGAIVAGGVYLYMRRDAFKKQDPKVDPRIEAARIANASVEPGFKAAREMLVAGKFDEAAKSLDELEARPSVPQPLLNWITLHRGLARLVVGKEQEAREIFAKIVERGAYSLDPAELKMSAFFMDAARELVDAFPIQASKARDYDKSNYQSIALLLFALKDWQMGNFDEAGPLFRQFHSSSPEAPYQWIGDYKEFATSYIDAYAEYREVSAKLRAANSIEERRAAVALAKEARDKISVKGKLATILDDTIKTIEESIVARETEEAGKKVAQEASDAKALEEMRAQTGVLLTQLKFTEARTFASATIVKGEKAKSEQQSVLKRADALAKFKTRLIADINAFTYPQQIRRKSGAIVPGVATRANDLGVEIRTPYGNTPLVWTDFSLDTMWNMGRHFLQAEQASGEKPDRMWWTGAFGLFAGKKAEAKAMLSAAAEAKAEYKNDLPLFLEAADAP
ncbi:MAG: serine/threonine-protein kinase, partial [Chthoniobacteraceae bacterium]